MTEVAIELQRLGCEVIGIDRYDHAPAMRVAQDFSQFAPRSMTEIVLAGVRLT